MDIRALKYFLAIAREESITKAAEALHMTQPPLSRQMKELEYELGKELFKRGTKKITLTEEGQILKKRAEEIMALMDKTISEISFLDDNVSGVISIAAGEAENISYIAKVAKSIRDQYPDIQFELYSGDSHYVKEKLDHGIVDFGLFIGNVDIELYDYIKLPISERWGVIMKDNSELAKYDSITPQQLNDKPLILSHQSYQNSEMSHWLTYNGMTPNIVATYNLAYNASIFVKNGLGYMIAFDHIINTSIGSGVVFRPLLPSIKADISIVWKKNQKFGKASQIFLNKIMDNINTKTML